MYDLTFRELSAIVSTVLVLVGTLWYVLAAIFGSKVKPVLASWIVLGGTMTLSFATYWTTPNKSIVSNACNAASVISTLSILVTAGVLYWKSGKRIEFSGFQKWCLAISAGIAILWAVLVGMGGTGIVPNILTQVLMVIGYVVTVQKLWGAAQNTESFVMWSCIMVASFIAVYTAVVSNDALACLYSVRASLASGTMVLLMVRIELRQRKVVIS